VTARPCEQRGLEELKRPFENLEVQPLLQVVDFSNSCAPALALAGFCRVFD
jgi:hypothetical protein